MGLFLHRFSSRSDLPFRRYYELSSHTWASTHLSLARSYSRRAPSVRRSVRLIASAVVLATLPYTSQRSNVSHGIFCPSLSLSLSRSSAVSLSLSLSLFVSFLRYLRPLFRRNYYFFSFRSYKALFSIFCFVHVIHFLSYPVLVLGF